MIMLFQYNYRFIVNLKLPNDHSVINCLTDKHIICILIICFTQFYTYVFDTFVV